MDYNYIALVCLVLFTTTALNQFYFKPRRELKNQSKIQKKFAEDINQMFDESVMFFDDIINIKTTTEMPPELKN